MTFPFKFPHIQRIVLVSAWCLPALLFLNSTPAARGQTLDLSRLVVVGDSLSAGVQNFALLDTQQPNGYAPLVARQAGVPLVQPLIAFPGLPNVLQLNGFDPLPVIAAAPGTLPAQPRDNPTEQPTDLAEPGITVAGALAPPSVIPAPVGGWARLVLESPAFPNGPVGQVQEAVALKPTSVILWLGNNDALVPALVGAMPLLTPVSAVAGDPNPLHNFTGSFGLVVGALAQTKATLIIANIPDVTEVPFFTSIETIATVAGMPVNSVAASLGAGPGDYLRSSALSFAIDILIGKTSGPLPAICPAPFAGFPAPAVPCILTASDASLIKTHVDGYNAVIVAAVAGLNSARPGSAVLVDIHQLVDTLYQTGYNVPGRDLTTTFFGGLFSLDGIHPTNTGYAIIANEFIAAMNTSFKANIPAIDINKVAKKDPLVFSLGQLKQIDK